MGKEQDLLQAAKSGNVAQIEKILGVKSRKSGIQSFINRTVNPNHQDEMGNTPLHHAALNGHRSSVELLLKYDASCNIPDNSGNYPLHLAAWNGHADVARVLLNTGPSRANVNEQNGTEETALHSAAQFGHSLVVAILLENHADPYVRNGQQESPLDLAAQYGRMETVKQLLNYHPNLLEDVNMIKTHSPLHLAARNGHMNVVSYFLSCGMDPNIQCNSGTALHEAALFGKVDVVNLLLQCGIDATVVDSNNKTVMDLLSSHPSAKAREIRDLIYASSAKDPMSALFSPLRQRTGIERSRGARNQTNKFIGPINRTCSAVYARDFTYSDVPDPLPFYDGMDPSYLRRSGTYDMVPRPRQESLKQGNYDSVPPPRDALSADRLRSTAWHPSLATNISSSGVDYSLIGPAEESPSGTVPALSPHEITEGYTLLGSPAQGTGAQRYPLVPNSTYAEVRTEGNNFLQPRVTLPSAGGFEDYSRLRFPSSADDGVPTGIPGKDNPAYFMVSHSHPSRQHSQSVKQNIDSYDFVTPIPKPRPASYHQSVYEVPPLAGRRRGNGQERDQSGTQGPVPPIFGGRSPEVYENTPFYPQREEQQPSQDPDYYLVAPPSRKPSEAAMYDKLPEPSNDVAAYRSGLVSGQEMSTYDNVPMSGQGAGTYDNVPYFSHPQFLTGRPHSLALSGGASSYGNQACPLDIPSYEFVQLRKPSGVTNGAKPEMQPFAQLPGYEPMAPPEDQSGRGDDYELLAPAVEPKQRPDNPGDYETLAMVGPQNTGSQARGTQHANGAMSLSLSAALYEVPPSISSPVYETAPARRTTPMSSPVYEIAPPPRQAAPMLPPRETSTQPPDSHEERWIEKEGAENPSELPPRRQNQYSEWPFAKKEQTEPPSIPSKSGSYEQVRLEGPVTSATDWGRVQSVSPRRSGGEYCTLSDFATGPGETGSRSSSGSSERSSVAETPLTPPFSPPSPKTAEAALFDALGTLPPSEMSTIPEGPENNPELQLDRGDSISRPTPLPRKRVSKASKPKILPRGDSLHDEEFKMPTQTSSLIKNNTSNVSEQKQDPFSFPPVASTSEVEPRKEASKKSDFAELHKKFSPYSSREDLTADSEEAVSGLEKKREEPDGAETAVKASPLVYENVLFRRKDKVQGSDNELPTSEESNQRPDSYRLSTLSADSPMDETEEWKKIEAFLSTLGQFDILRTLEVQIAEAVSAKTVAEWLKALDLGQYESTMMANGFDDIRYLNGVLEDEDLLEIGIVDFSHRRTLIEAVKSLQRCPRLSDQSINKPENVRDWLVLIGLPEYLEIFQHNGFTSMERVTMLWEVELTSVLEINSLGHRKRMLASVTKEPKKVEIKQEIVKATDLEDSSAHLEDQLAELKMYCPDEKPEAVTTSVPSSANDFIAAAEAMITEGLETPAEDKKRDKRWKHDPSVLIKGSVNYSILYLGSHAVKKITGLESTIEACRKMRLSTAKLQKIPSVVLSVSVKGIKFIDARSSIMVSFHDMRNISYITQDPKDRQVMAYIAKDAKTEKHYCHVFRAESNRVSDEVTMTIGQAFELAFDQFLQAQNPRCEQ